MKKTIITLALSSAAVAVALSAQSTHAAATGSLSLLARLDRPTLVTVDAARPKGTSAGDTVDFSVALVRDGKAAGRGEFAQTVVDNRYQGISMQAELLLPDGTLELQGGGVNKRPPGGAEPTRDSELAVVGGTGAYAGARGTARLSAAGRTTQRVDIVFLP
jgi:hypothetical protein